MYNKHNHKGELSEPPLSPTSILLCILVSLAMLLSQALPPYSHVRTRPLLRLMAIGLWCRLNLEPLGLLAGRGPRL